MKTAFSASAFSITCFLHSFLVALLALLTVPGCLFAQQYLGVGFHLTPPVHLDDTGNPSVAIGPTPGMAGSLTYKWEWGHKGRQHWYAETGLSTQGLRYHQVDYHNDTVTVWTDFGNSHLGFPSVLLGGGRSFGVGRHGAFTVGLETSLVLEQTLEFIASSTYGISNYPDRDIVFPLHLRLNLAYVRDLQLFPNVAGQLQWYANLSAQNVTHGEQYSRNLIEGGALKKGRYTLNNSELGLKFFVGLNKRTREAPLEKHPENKLLAQQERHVRYRISVVNQAFALPRTVYHIPQVDSFSVKGKLILTNQLGVLLSLPSRRNDLWSTVFGLGIGVRASGLAFHADGRFPADQQPIAFKKRVTGQGLFAIANLGFSRRHMFKGRVMEHTLTGSALLPLKKENVDLRVPLNSDPQAPILAGRVNYAYGREQVLFGVEYNPELHFRLSGAVFAALGLVTNYSWGITGQGHFTVSNAQTSYYGVMLQGFSKFGVSFRVGLER